MSKTRIDTPLSPDTLAELRRIGEALSDLHPESDALAYLSLRVEGENHSQGPVEIAVSSETLAQITQLIKKAGDTKSAGNRRRQDELTTQEAADLLGVSRPYLVKLLDTGQIPHRRVGQYRRVRRVDLEQFEEKDQARRKAGLEELAGFTQDIGLEY